MSQTKLRICYECGLAFEPQTPGHLQQCNCLPEGEVDYDRPADPGSILLILTVGIALLLAGACLGMLTTNPW